MTNVELLVVSIGVIAVSVALVIWSAIVYRGWFFGSHPWADVTRRRLYWHHIRAGIPLAWLQRLAATVMVPGRMASRRDRT